VRTLTEFKDKDAEQGRSIAKVFDKWHFYYNKQSIMLTNVDEDGKAIEMPTKTNKEGETVEEKSIKLAPIKITQTSEENTVEISQFEYTIKDLAGTDYKSLDTYLEYYIKPLVSAFDYKEANLKVFTDKNCYFFDSDKETMIESSIAEPTVATALGCGKIVIKAAAKKDPKTKLTKSIVITAELTKDLQKDYEIIPYDPDEVINQTNIAAFMAKYITKPFEYIENVLGVEINFNKVFYTPEVLRATTTITADLDALEQKLKDLENSLNL
jgi:type I restriction enzyme M protein